jgi:adenosylcobinamide-GDP ribazoletransferase
MGWSDVALAPVVIAGGIWLGGGLHHDGLMDTADGLAAGAARRLEAMEDSRVGASGALALAVVLLLQLAALLQLHEQAPLALILAGFWGRVSPLWAMARFNYLRSDGTAGFHRRYGQPWWDVVPTVVACLAFAPFVTPLPLLIGAPVAVGVAERLGRRLGGHTGDSYGAVEVVTEVITLLLLAGLAAAN